MVRLFIMPLFAMVLCTTGCQSYPTVYVDAVSVTNNANDLTFALTTQSHGIGRTLLAQNLPLHINEFIREHGWRPAPDAPTLLEAHTSDVEQTWVMEQVRQGLLKRGYTEDRDHPSLIIAVAYRYGAVYFIEPRKIEYERDSHDYTLDDHKRRDEYRRKWGHYPYSNDPAIEMREKTTITEGGPQSLMGGGISIQIYQNVNDNNPQAISWEGSVVTLASDWSWRAYVPMMIDELFTEYPVPANVPHKGTLRPKAN